MKVQNSSTISAFGGINFVFECLEEGKFMKLFEKYLPDLAPQCIYNWQDIIYSILSIYLCGGDCIEDLQTHLKPHFQKNPFVNLPSSDTVLKRLKEVSEDNNICFTKRGTVEHTYNRNSMLEELNVALLKELGAFSKGETIIDYDNTILFNEKSDSKMTYKRNPGYQPGVCTLNEEQVLYIENRNGNSDAKSFQEDTLRRIFTLLKSKGIKKVDHFRADAASYQFDVIKLLEKEVNNFYIGCRNSYIEKYFPQINKWSLMIDTSNEIMEVGEITITPFQQQARKNKKTTQEYRLIVKRKLKKDGQLNLFTQDAYEYRAILTNNTQWSALEIAQFYNHRGNMEKQFDILKNDFGWNNMPFSKLDQNTVFLYITAICRNLYHYIIRYFSEKIKSLKPTFRVKKFLFRFIILPAKWIRRSRQNYLKIYGTVNLTT
ncbi:MAG TPA: IS1380 family transposase [Chitinispirillaceae bacterium]|nr:IS1380 family transposase [Chitinispirillaceae bacterium]